jgi:hypothetical protein
MTGMAATSVDKGLEEALRADVETLRREGWRPPNEQAQQLPTITALAACDPDSDAPYEVVCWAIGQLDKGRTRSQGALALLGIKIEHRQTVRKRLDAAAPFFNYSTGDSFRHSPEYAALLTELTEQLVGLAKRCGFVLGDAGSAERGGLPPAEVEPESVLPESVTPQSAGDGEGSSDRATPPRKRYWAAAVIALVLVFATLAYTQLSTGSGRPVYDYHKLCAVCGPLGTSAVFNSGIHVDSYQQGDERNFLTAQANDNSPYPGYRDPLVDVDKIISHQVIVRLYIHNNSQSYSAHNTHVGFTLPSGAGTDLTIMGYVRADNAQPKVVSDSVHLIGKHKFALRYVPNTAVLDDYGSGSFGLEEPHGIGDIPISGTAAGRTGEALPEHFRGDVEISVEILPA